MADYSLNEWWQMRHSPVDNPLPALQLGASIVQHRAQQDLQERELGNQIARTSLMRDEMMYKQKIQTQLTEGNAKMAEAIAGVDDWTDDEQVSKVWETGSQYPMTVGGKAWLGAQHMHESAITARRLQEDATSRAAARDRQTEMANNIGWVYPEDGSPPYLVDAKGGTHFAPFHAGLDAGFTPEKTTVGGVDMIHVSPNKWQVVNRPPPEGKMTDIEREDLRDARKKRQAIVDSLPATAPKSGFFGASKADIEAYTSKTNQIAELTAREDAIHNAISARASGSSSPSKVTREGLKTIPPAAIVPAAQDNMPKFPSMPSRKEDLQKDEVYITPRGMALWDGEKFIPQ